MVGDAATHAWRSRHISIRGNLLHQAVTSGEVSFEYVNTKEQKADMLTKGLTFDLHEKAMDGLCLCITP
jgi:hypothetical protein